MLLWGDNRLDGFEARKPTREDALQEASRCLVCYKAPCENACPAGVPVSTFIRRMRFGDFGGALRAIVESNVLAGTCGLTCPRDMLCEQACVLREGSSAIAIRDLQLSAYLYGKEGLLKKVPQLVKTKIAILGGGPAGIACAYYLRRKGLYPVIFERHSRIGGMVARVIPGYKLIDQVIEQEISYATDGVEIRTGIADQAVSLDWLKEQGFEAVFLATGLWRQSLQANQYVHQGIAIDAVSLLEQLRSQPGSARRLGKSVAVIGGGNTACDVATAIKVFSDSDVTVYYRRSRQDMPAFKHEFENALLSGVVFKFNMALVGAEKVGAKVILRLARTEPGQINGSGRPSPQIVAGSEFCVEVDNLVVATGGVADTDWIQNRFGVDIEKGRILVDEAMMTSKRGVFAGGDLVRGGGLVVEAVADGRKAAESIAALFGR